MGGRGSTSPQAIQHAGEVAQRALEWSRAKLGSFGYSPLTWDRLNFFGTPQCNVFVVHAFNYGNAGQAPIDGKISRWSIFPFYPLRRSPSAREIYLEGLPGFRLIKTPRPGDVATNAQHVGIVSGKGKTISASIISWRVVENDWGFRTKDGRPSTDMRFYRYTGAK